LGDKGLQPLVFDYDYDDEHEEEHEEEHDGRHTGVALPAVFVKH